MSVSLEVSEFIAVVRLDKPPVNALARETRQRLIEVFDEISERSDIRVAIPPAPASTSAPAPISRTVPTRTRPATSSATTA
jgi:hypothetical protein